MVLVRGFAARTRDDTVKPLAGRQHLTIESRRDARGTGTSEEPIGETRHDQPTKDEGRAVSE